MKSSPGEEQPGLEACDGKLEIFRMRRTSGETFQIQIKGRWAFP